MNDKPKSDSIEAELRGIEAALRRAAARARERARATGTRLVFSRNGKIEYVDPNQFRIAEDGAGHREDE